MNNYRIPALTVALLGGLALAGCDNTGNAELDARTSDATAQPTPPSDTLDPQTGSLNDPALTDPTLIDDRTDTATMADVPDPVTGTYEDRQELDPQADPTLSEEAQDAAEDETDTTQPIP